MSDSASSEYDPRGFPPVAVTVDIVLFTISEGALQILLIQRGVEPFQGSWALPGGFVRPDEDLNEAAARELAEETGVDSSVAYLEQLATYGAPDRDPRMRVVTVAYWAACDRISSPVGGSDAARAALVPVSLLEEGTTELAFDHQRIVIYAVERLRAKLEYTALAARFCGPEFTISELRKVYEAVWNTRLDPGNFQRKIRENHAFAKVGDDRDERSLRSLVRQASPLLERTTYSVEHELEVEERDTVAAQEATAPADRAEAWSAEGDQIVHQSFMPADGLADIAPPRPDSVRAMASPGPRGGRPASLWTAVDPELKLNSPIARRHPPLDSGSG